MERKPWYTDGLRFECHACGACCRTHGEADEYAFVYLAEQDVEAVAAHMGLDRAEFMARFCARNGGGIHLRTDTVDCPLLDAQGRCRAYEVRPKQCAAWPFWRENLTRRAWDGPVKACCPGIGQGPLHTADEIDRIADERDEWYAQ
ncbi:MAG: YkgJ family cysteine cluster protein [Deltaproteobacteria bacterium]|nr:YkgJ family cysteine cluster protein [Deltaproteobacteria bacterium]